MNERQELMKSSIETLLLSLINEQPRYGYQIIKELERRSTGYFRFKEGTLYPALHRLEKASLAEARWQTLPSGQQRKYYHITQQGRQVLAARRDEWRNFLTAVDLIFKPAPN